MKSGENGMEVSGEILTANDLSGETARQAAMLCEVVVKYESV
jgi:hypothetical protein